MISLTIRFQDETRMFEWVDDMVQCQALDARAWVRREVASDRLVSRRDCYADTHGPRYILKGSRWGGRRALELRTETTVEVVESPQR